MEQVEGYFEGKPGSYAIFQVIRDRIAAVGPCEMSVASQISFRVRRKFAWFWLYNVTGSTPEGVPHLMLAVREPLDDPHVRNVSQISAYRWNLQVVVRTLDDARSEWLGALLERAYAYGSHDG